MKKVPFNKLSIEEIGAIICSHLEKYNISIVLVGGACVTIYSNNRYESGDLDFVMGDYSLKEIDPIMAEIGFIRSRSSLRHYEHPNCPYFVEFPPGPLTLGDEFVSETASLKTKYGTLRLLTPVDSVKDRLAAFYHWNDRQSLEQALLICSDQKIDLVEVKRWSQKEKVLEKYEYFLQCLKVQKDQKVE